VKHYLINELSFPPFKPVLNLQVVAGSRPRATITHEQTGQRYLLKFSSHNSREVWAELLASKLAQLATIPCQEVTIKQIPASVYQILKDRQHIGADVPPIATLARNIFPRDYEITYGQRIVNTPSDALTLEEIEILIRSRYYSPEDILDSFAQMIIFDSWIGNMDRHHENWGVSEHITIRSGQQAIEPAVLVNKRHFSPLYDHGSSLLFELGENKVKNYLSNKELFKDSYILGKKYTLIKMSNGSMENVFKVVDNHIAQNDAWGVRFKQQIEKIRSVSDLALAAEILKMPHHDLIDYTDERRELLYYSLLERKNILEQIVDGRLSLQVEE
jgi:hypothetical protein